MLPCLRHRKQWTNQLSGRGLVAWWRSSHREHRLVARARPRAPSDPNDLRTVPGIGARTAGLLANKNITAVPELRQVFVQDYSRDAGQFIEYLTSLGVKRRWGLEITRFIQETSRPITFCVEGHIGAGKSTYLDMVKQSDSKQLNLLGRSGHLHELIEVVPEPVDEWQDVDGANLLDVFYQNPARYAYTFQSYVFVTRLLQEERSRDVSASLRLLERSVFCDRMVFVKAVHEAQHLSELELKLYDSWFNPMIKLNPNLTPDGFVYLKTQPDTCLRRLRHRNRSEEVGIGNDYLERLGEFHEDWLVRGAVKVGDLLARASSRRLENGQTVIQTSNTLFPASTGSGPGAAGTTLQLHMPNGAVHKDLVIPKLPGMLQGNVVLLDNKRLTSDVDKPHKSLASLHMVPALHVDCDEDIDVTDVDLMAHRAQMMVSFREWVGQYRSANESFFADKATQRQQEHNTLREGFLADAQKLRGSMHGARGSLEALSHVL